MGWGEDSLDLRQRRLELVYVCLRVKPVVQPPLYRVLDVVSPRVFSFFFFPNAPVLSLGLTYATKYGH